jgi:hypothetical protein
MIKRLHFAATKFHWTFDQTLAQDELLFDEVMLFDRQCAYKEWQRSQNDNDWLTDDEIGDDLTDEPSVTVDGIAANNVDRSAFVNAMNWMQAFSPKVGVSG